VKKKYKGIILAGGSGSRLSPLTEVVCKQLLPVYDKPMIYYPLSVLMIAGISDILIITNPKDLDPIKNLLGDGSHLGINLKYKVQEKPRGIAEAFILGKEFIDDSNICLVLGDNLLFSQALTKELEKSKKQNKGGTIFAYKVKNPKNFGIIDFDKKFNIKSIEEKPKNPKSNYASIGIYFYDNNVVKYANNLKPSKRNELEITDINKIYLKNRKLSAQVLGRGTAWIDMGTPDSLYQASSYVKEVQSLQRLQISNIEEIAFRKKWINKNQLNFLIKNMKISDYRKYLQDLIKGI
jgi:glucose-1-phosphate thymidylyltransferase